MAGNDKRLYKQLSHQDSGSSSCSNNSILNSNNTITSNTALQALSPPLTFMGSPLASSGTSPANATMLPSILVRTMSGSSTQGMGGVREAPQMCDTISSRTLFYLRSTLTSSFQPDYDFTDAKSDEFSRVPSIHWVKYAVRENLSAAAGEMFTTFEDQLWVGIDEEIHLMDCDIYRWEALCCCSKLKGLSLCKWEWILCKYWQLAIFYWPYLTISDLCIHMVVICVDWHIIA